MLLGIILIQVAEGSTVANFLVTLFQRAKGNPTLAVIFSLDNGCPGILHGVDFISGLITLGCQTSPKLDIYSRLETVYTRWPNPDIAFPPSTSLAAS
jgi:hypothetical protein